MRIGSLGYVSVEINNCEMCGRKVEGYKMCEECREYCKCVDGWLVDFTLIEEEE